MKKTKKGRTTFIIAPCGSNLHLTMNIEASANALPSLFVFATSTFVGAFWVAFCIAVLEACVFTTFLMPGSILTVSLGAGVALGWTNGYGAVGGIMFGMFTGDHISYWSIRIAGVLLHDKRFSADVIQKAANFSRHPGRTLFLCHLCPYLSGVGPASVALGGTPYSRFLVYDTVGVVVGSLWFLGVGHLLGKSSQAFAGGLVHGVGVCTLALILSFGLYRAGKASYRKRGVMFILSSFLEYPVFLLQGYSYRFLPLDRKMALERNRQKVTEVAKPGDIFLVIRHSGGPWGVVSHVGIFETADTVIHAFHKVRREKVTLLPLRDGFGVARVEMVPEEVEGLLQYLQKQLGKPFCLVTTKAHASSKGPQHFSCATLVWAAFKHINIDLSTHAAVAQRWVFPRDIATNPLVQMVACAEETNIREETAISKTQAQPN